MKDKKLRVITQGAVIAALYAALTLAPFLSSMAFGPVQVRVSEALTIMPMYSFGGIWGLFAGCLISNMLSPAGPNLVDIVFGSLATLFAAYLTRALRQNRFIALLAPVVINAIVVGSYIPFLYAQNLPIPVSIAQIGLGEAVAVYVLGLPLSYVLDRYKGRLFED